jgi:hypothetical protein
MLDPAAKPGPTPSGRSGRSSLFLIESTYLLVLAVVFVVYNTSHAVRQALPASIGGLPVGVPRFGAVGATLISLTTYATQEGIRVSGTHEKMGKLVEINLTGLEVLLFRCATA